MDTGHSGQQVEINGYTILVSKISSSHTSAQYTIYIISKVNIQYYLYRLPHNFWVIIMSQVYTVEVTITEPR